MMYALAGWLALQLLSRLCEGRQGVKFTLRASPFLHEWELFDWLPHWTANQWDTGDEGQSTIRTYRAFALHGEILFFRWTVNGALFRYEMTREEAERLQALAPRIEHREGSAPVLMNPKDAAEHAVLHRKYTRLGRRAFK